MNNFVDELRDKISSDRVKEPQPFGETVDALYEELKDKIESKEKNKEEPLDSKH